MAAIEEDVDGEVERGLQRRPAVAVELHLAGAGDGADVADRGGRPARDLLATVATRADCVGGAFYIQDGVVCAPALCGNGVVEPNEDCDDGNTADGDSCPASCVR
ncbi:MAG TPA: DUF4215 domain-containing protein [Candidatus Dormibacteraeota bacterium]|nr:DUF4215 domain-containing protein [Candidatus Dormibacteraeota bacterium]